MLSTSRGGEERSQKNYEVVFDHIAFLIFFVHIFFIKMFVISKKCTSKGKSTLFMFPTKPLNLKYSLMGF